jgi:hypothetical protein
MLANLAAVVVPVWVFVAAMLCVGLFSRRILEPLGRRFCPGLLARIGDQLLPLPREGRR